MVQRPNRRKDW